MRAQILTTIIVNCLTIVYGISIGWAAPNMLLFQSEQSPIGVMTSDQLSLIVSIMCIGGFVGTVVFGSVADGCGRKDGLILITLPAITGNILLIIGNHYYYIYAARFLFGLTGGATFIMVPIFITEISSVRIRGTLGSVLTVSMNVGIVIGYTLASWTNYYTVPYVAIGISAIFLAIFVWLPESPDFLAHHKNSEKAKKSYQFYGTFDGSSAAELQNSGYETLKDEEEEGQSKAPKLTMKDFTDKSVRNGFLISLVLTFFVHATGILTITNYMTELFAWAKIDLDVYVATIAVGLIQILGSLTSFMFVDRFGRRVLLCCSALGTGLGLFAFGLYYYLLSQVGYEELVQRLQWLPVVALGVTVFVATCGVTTLPYILISELSPVKLRSAITTIVVGILWGYSFLIQYYFHTLVNYLGVAGAAWTFATVSFLEVIFVYFVLPETKNLTIDEIQEKLK